MTEKNGFALRKQVFVHDLKLVEVPYFEEDSLDDLVERVCEQISKHVSVFIKHPSLQVHFTPRDTREVIRNRLRRHMSLYN